MSEAPRRMASSMTLLTKRTIGASSTSSRRDLVAELLVAAGDLEVLEVEVVLVAEAATSACRPARSPCRGASAACRPSTTTLDAKAGLELDLVERMQVGRVGDREEQPLAAPEQRQDPVLGQQLVADQRTASRSRLTASRSSSGTPNSFEAAMAMSRALAAPLAARAG